MQDRWLHSDAAVGGITAVVVVLYVVLCAVMWHPVLKDDCSSSCGAVAVCVVLLASQSDSVLSSQWVCCTSFVLVCADSCPHLLGADCGCWWG